MRQRAQATQPPPPGWYQAPGEAFVDRYWDGGSWTDRSRPRPAAGSGPPSPALIETVSLRQARLLRTASWVATAVGSGLLISAAFMSAHPGPVAGLLGIGGAVIGSTSMALLREDRSDRIDGAVGLAAGSALVVAGVVAAVIVSSTVTAWFTIGCGLVLVAVILRRLRRPQPHDRTPSRCRSERHHDGTA